MTAVALTDETRDVRPSGATLSRAVSGLAPALIESRQRWRDLALLGADLVFETDAAGQFALFECGATATGVLAPWHAPAWVGRAATDLLLTDSADPFALRAVARDFRAWLRRDDDDSGCFAFTVAPLFGPAGEFRGLRGAARDITADTNAAAIQAASRRRTEAREALAHRIRQAVLAPEMLIAMLESLPAALGLAGAAVLEADALGMPRAAERHGEDPTPLVDTLPPLGDERGWEFLDGPGGRQVALFTAPPRTAPYVGLLAWRNPGGRPFDADDRHLLTALSDLLVVILVNHLAQRQLERQARTEPLTGLLNRGAFLADLQRRLDRHWRAPSVAPAGTLLFIDLDNLKPINDRFGHSAGDAALAAVARLLRDMARPYDVAGRLGGDEFGLWLDGADGAAGEARASALCMAATRAMPADTGWRRGLTLSIGCAVVQGGVRETPEALLARADGAMYAAKRQGRNGWQLAPAPAEDAA